MSRIIRAVFNLAILGGDANARCMGDSVHGAGHALLFRLANPERVFIAARCLTIASGVAMLVALAALAWRHFGPLRAVAGVAAVAFDTTTLGQFSLVSTDALVTAALICRRAVLDWRMRQPSITRSNPTNTWPKT